MKNCFIFFIFMLIVAQTAITKYLRRGGLTTETYFLTVLEFGSLDQGTGWWGCDDKLLLGLKMAASSLCSCSAKGVLVFLPRLRRAPGWIEAPPLGPHVTLITSLKTLISFTWRVRSSTCFKFIYFLSAPPVFSVKLIPHICCCPRP